MTGILAEEVTELQAGGSRVEAIVPDQPALEAKGGLRAMLEAAA